jgi:hypothetical protein
VHPRAAVRAIKPCLDEEPPHPAQYLDGSRRRSTS